MMYLEAVSQARSVEDSYLSYLMKWYFHFREGGVSQWQYFLSRKARQSSAV